MAQMDNKIPKILIIDDVDTNRQVLRNIILEMDCQPVLAENGVQALKFIERFTPQLVISDIAMPQMDGYEFCEIMKKNPQTRDIPIIFISAFDNTQDVLKGFNLGVEDYIVKPFIPEVVKARVGVHLKLSETSQRLQITNKRLKTSIDEQLKQMEMERRNVLYALLRVARENAAYDVQHMERLCYDCRILSEAMQLSVQYGGRISDTYIDIIEMAAPLSDLGNVAVPTDILQKKDCLTQEERSIMQTHTTVGAKILRDVRDTVDSNTFLDMAIELAESHHENWDGSGFPYGKKGDEIPLSAQIVGIMSEYCALIESRTYRDSNSADEAILIMEDDAGVKFNPQLFMILKKIYRQMH
jgi:putative two-component system response regulator